MQQPGFDPGLTQQYSGKLRRAINPDGSFNVVRRGTDWRDVHPYLRLVTMSWARFFGVILMSYATVNIFFACVYYLLGPDALQGSMISDRHIDRFLSNIFFSSQTLTTVGFGAIAPRSHMANLVAAFEALMGLLGFAVATGVLLGRVSKPSARIGFSTKALMTPYQDGYSFQFRIVNRRQNSLMELEATVTLMLVDPVDGVLRRDFKVLKLERDRVLFFPLTWTIVHPIAADSPMLGLTQADLEKRQAEVLILVKAWDETFSQTVHQRFSYRYDEIVWDGKFRPAFAINDNGDMVLEVGDVSAYNLAETKELT
jgi:inward rectifier potassium channel